MLTSMPMCLCPPAIDDQIGANAPGATSLHLVLAAAYVTIPNRIFKTLRLSLISWLRPASSNGLKFGLIFDLIITVIYSSEPRERL